MNKKQQQILNKVFEKPERSDILWVNVESLFIALGAKISEGRGSRVRVALNGVRAVFHQQAVTQRLIYPISALE